MTFIDGRAPRIGMFDSGKVSFPRSDITSELVNFINSKNQAAGGNEGSSLISKPVQLTSEERTARVAFDQNQLQAQSDMIRQQLGI